jgi:hypothetical protein
MKVSLKLALPTVIGLGSSYKSGFRQLRAIGPTGGEVCDSVASCFSLGSGTGSRPLRFRWRDSGGITCGQQSNFCLIMLLNLESYFFTHFAMIAEWRRSRSSVDTS